MTTSQRYQPVTSQGKDWAAHTLAPPSFMFFIDYGTFKKSAQERGALETMKKKIPKSRGHKFKRLTLLTT